MSARPESPANRSDTPDQGLRAVLDCAQAAVWDWQVPVDRFEVDEAWLRALGVDYGAAALTTSEWKRCVHPDDHGAFVAAAESCHVGEETHAVTAGD